MEYAIIETSGRQFWVEPKKFIEFNRLILKIGSTLLIRRILFVKKELLACIGQPYLEGAVVKGIISKHFLGPKIVVFKMKPKKKYQRKIGHRQKLTRLLINDIEEIYST
uniref:50S ribosomal protein L21 n=1 Tax=Sporochnus bolleanus TaxID=461143 RepID=UPI002E7A9041|nr:50S ribosomal protein L21 [Sporochnus bolleanus]WAM64848.1 50S ribosomal protein L21 [Sporochnus bolleanus]